MRRGDKLYIVTRRDLSPGYQAVQSIHAAQQFAIEHPLLNKEWQDKSNYLGLLSVKDEKALLHLASRAAKIGLSVSLFCEPDVNWKCTAIAIGPSSVAKLLLRKLPLALSK